MFLEIELPLNFNSQLQTYFSPSLNFFMTNESDSAILAVDRRAQFSRVLRFGGLARTADFALHFGIVLAK